MTTTPTTSPLLELSGLPRFDAIQPAHVEPAVRSLLEALGATVERLQDDPAAPTWDNFVEPIENDGERKRRARWIDGVTPTKYGRKSSTNATGFKSFKVSALGLASVRTLSVACSST